MFSISNNIAAIARMAEKKRKETRFAAAVAITRTAQDIKEIETRELSRRLDRPTGFTKRAYAVKPATKNNLIGAVFAKDVQEKYLRYVESGGRRRPKGKAIPVPVRHRRNKFGNLPKNAVRRAVNKQKTFSGVPKGGGKPGIYQRVNRGRGLKLLIGYAKKAEYKPRLGFKRRARAQALRRYPKHFAHEYRRALIRAR